MNKENNGFFAFPSVVLADSETEVSLFKAEGEIQDGEYLISLIPADGNTDPTDVSLTLHGKDTLFPQKTAYAAGGVLKFKHFFKGEGEWSIKLRQIDGKEDAIAASLYSLYPDLYERLPKRADLHVHTNRSDGSEGPLYTAASYRKAGYDRIAITDHAEYDAGRAVRERLDFNTDFSVLCGEEIHNKRDGQLHIVCLEADCSISEIMQNEGERAIREARALAKTHGIPGGVPEDEYLLRLWTYKEAKRHGGFVIFPHPFWRVGGVRRHVSASLAKAIITNGLCDAFEIIRGVGEEENNLQTSLYIDAASEGVKIPVVGSTDNHSVRGKFDTASTVVFESGGNLTEAIALGYSVAAEHKGSGFPKLYGPFRFVSYADFLFRAYFPHHTRLCAASGKLMLDYLLGYTDDKEMLEELEERVRAFEGLFFGR